MDMSSTLCNLVYHTLRGAVKLNAISVCDRFFGSACTMMDFEEYKTENKRIIKISFNNCMTFTESPCSQLIQKPNGS